MTPVPLLDVVGLSKRHGARVGCADVSFRLYPGEVMGVVGESGSGKSTLLTCLAGHQTPDAGRVMFDTRTNGPQYVLCLREPDRRRLWPTDWVIVHQNPRDGLRMGVSAGGNVGERLMAQGVRNYGEIRARAAHRPEQVEINPSRIDEPPSGFSGGMQQRLQIARNLVTGPRLVLMDEPTASLDPQNREGALSLIEEAKARGAAIVGFFQGAEARARVADREIDVSSCAPDAR